MSMADINPNEIVKTGGGVAPPLRADTFRPGASPTWSG